MSRGGELGLSNSGLLHPLKTIFYCLKYNYMYDKNRQFFIYYFILWECKTADLKNVQLWSEECCGLLAGNGAHCWSGCMSAYLVFCVWYFLGSSDPLTVAPQAP